jgi:tRNA(Met) C34 N-acetyltransferase TmcA
MTRLIVDVSTEQHQLIKALAATEGKTIKQFVLEKVLPPTNRNQEEAWDELKSILQDRLEQVSKEGASTRSVSDITEATLRKLRASD